MSDEQLAEFNKRFLIDDVVKAKLRGLRKPLPRCIHWTETLGLDGWRAAERLASCRAAGEQHSC